MASPFMLQSVDLYVGAFEMSNFTNNVVVDISVADLDVTTFGSNGSKAHLGGLKDASIAVKGLKDASHLPDGNSFANLAVKDVVISVSPDGNDGSVIYGMRATELDFKPYNDSVGQVASFELMATNSNVNGFVRSTVMNPVATPRTATGSGTIRQLGAVSATQSVFGTLHVTAVAGTTPNMVVTVQSAVTVGFGSPTTRLTFTAATGVTYEWKSLVGPITDTYWRVSYTVTGTTPSFTFAAGIGIQ